MDRDVDLLQELLSSWANMREEVVLEDFLSLDLPDAVVGRELDPEADAIPLRTACWLMFLHGYWGGLKLGRRFRRVGAARGAEESGLMEARTPTEGDLEPICAALAEVHRALAGSGADLVAHLTRSARLPAQTGSLYGTAYNTGFFEPLLSRPPRGALPEHLTADPTQVVAAEDRLLEVEHQVPQPRWLTLHKARHWEARAAHPKEWDDLVAGTSSEEDLRELWRTAYRQGVYNWSGDTVAHWKQTTLDPFLYTSARFNMQLEGISHTLMTALTDPAGSDLSQPARASALFVPSWLGTALGVSDETGERPTVEG